MATKIKLGIRKFVQGTHKTLLKFRKLFKMSLAAIDEKSLLFMSRVIQRNT